MAVKKEDLSPEQRAILERLLERWRRMSPEARALFLIKHAEEIVEARKRATVH